MKTIPTIDIFEKPQRDNKGKFVKGNKVSIDNEGGLLCRLCTQEKEIMNKVSLYNEYTKGEVDGKVHMPWLEQLCDETYLNISDDTLSKWRDISNLDEMRHSIKLHTEFKDAVSRIFRRQRFYLKMGGLRASHSSFHQFLLETNHNHVRAERQILAGDADKPINQKLEIEITEAKKYE